MAGITYLLDTNVISDLLKRNVNVYARLQIAQNGGDTLCICQPVYYEVLRGLLWAGASTKERVFKEDFLPHFRWTPLNDDDWTQAARFWAVAVGTGKQLADTDLLVASVAVRLKAVIVSSDLDFDALSVQRVNWRDPLSSS